MQDNFIYSHEALLLAVWFCLPALLIGIVIQALMYWHRHVRLARATAAFIVSSIGTVALACLLWASLPASLAAPLFQPSVHIWFVPPFFLPGYLAGLVMVPLVARFIARVQLGIQPHVPTSGRSAG